MERLGFFGLAARSARTAAVPGAAFTSNVRNRRFHLIAAADEDWARKAIAELERRGEAPIAAAESLFVPAATAATEPGRSRDDQLAALARFERGKRC